MAKLLFSHFLRGRVLVAILLYALPFLALIVLGLVWLVEKGWFLHFMITTIVVIGTYRLIIWALQRRAQARYAVVAEPSGQSQPLVQENPEWTEAERAVFVRLREKIAARANTPLPWSSLQVFAFEVFEAAAGELSGGRRQALDFSVPEALLLCDRVITRFRANLRSHMPFADTISLRSLWWIWSNRAMLQRTARVAKGAWRVQRVLTNPPAGIMQELQNLLLGEAADLIQSSGEATIQRAILEEVARAAIDLHSGHLRFSDAELLEIELASHLTDANARPDDDAPLRVMVVGQISAGKTSLINALAGHELGETDMAPTTAGLVSHDLTFAGVEFTLVDSEGIDGSKGVSDRLLTQLLQADLVLWTVRANRPARAVDLALLARMREAYSLVPERRQPRVIVAVTAVDQLLAGWPFPEHLLQGDSLAKLAELVRTISKELGELVVLPVSTQSPEWNIAQLEVLIGQEAGEALMVQRNRRRVEGNAKARGVTAEAVRAGKGILKISRLAWRDSGRS